MNCFSNSIWLNIIMTLSRWKGTRGVTTLLFANFVAAISRTNSNQFEFVRLSAATKFCHSDNDFHKINHVTQGELLR